MKSNAQIVTFLKGQVGLFADFTDERLRDLIEGSTVVSFEPNEAIVHYGAPATHLGVVLAGVAAASVIGPWGTPLTLGRFEAGGTFGEMSYSRR
jgi:CRP-like cAMP-binding protein